MSWIDVDEVMRQQVAWTVQWHQGPTPAAAAMPWLALERNHRMNFELWHEEDIARRTDLGEARVGEAKRAIDRCNQARNDAVEQVDVWLLEQIARMPADAPLHSETPGMIIDRLSILALKYYHMKLEAERESASEEHRRRCGQRALILAEQSRDLRGCLIELLDQIQSGQRRFKLYRQLKMYNDATLNPQLYGGGQSARKP